MLANKHPAQVSQSDTVNLTQPRWAQMNCTWLWLPKRRGQSLYCQCQLVQDKSSCLLPLTSLHQAATNKLHKAAPTAAVTWGWFTSGLISFLNIFYWCWLQRLSWLTGEGEKNLIHIRTSRRNGQTTGVYLHTCFGHQKKLHLLL